MFSYVIAADSFKIGNDAEVNKASERLHKYGILHDCLLQHMLKKFQSEYPAAVQVTKEEVVDILRLFRLVARITKEAWFSEEGAFLLSDNRCTMTMVIPSLFPCLVSQEERSIPNTKQRKNCLLQIYQWVCPCESSEPVNS